MDLIIKGGTVVTAGSSFNADVGVQGGKVVQIGGQMSAPRVIDATGKLVVPGGVDAHVHLQPSTPPPPGSPPRSVDDFYAGSRGAVVGGVTTIGNMISPQPGETIGLLAMLDRAVADTRANSIVDFILHPVVVDPTPEIIAEIPKLAGAGYPSVKFFMVRPTFDGRLADYMKVLDVAGRNRIISLIHCEDAAINTFIQERLLAEGKSDIRYYPDSRPTYAEALATARAIAMARTTGAPVYIVHLSCAAALDVCRRARADGDRVYVEIRPIYLYLTRERFQEPQAAQYVGFPPLRERSDVDALWEGLRSGDIDTVCTDHAPWMLAQKLDPQLKIGTFRPGMANLETLMPMLYSEGVRKGRISVNRWVEIISTNAARLFGLFPQKGTIAVGSDADLVVWDPERKRTIRAKEMHTNSDFDVFEGWEVQGWPACTISRGEVVFEDGKITGAKGRGQLVKRAPFTIL